MIRIVAVAAASLCIFVSLKGSASAVTKSYEVGGRLYKYDSRDPLQVRAAQKLTDAANSADAARARAEAERASNPLVRLLGSKVQTDAIQLQKHLERAIAEHESTVAVGGKDLRSVGGSALAKLPVHAVAPGATSQRAAASSRAAKAAVPRTEPAVRKVVSDVVTGIKTTFMTDGSIYEEPIETASSSERRQHIINDEITGSVQRVD